jgi:hypothetical protein
MQNSSDRWKPDAPVLQPRDTSGRVRPYIVAAGAELHPLADAMTLTVAQANEHDPRHPNVMLRGDALVRLSDTPDGGVSLDPFTADSFAERASRDARYVKAAPTSTNPSPPKVHPPVRAVKAVLARNARELPSFPRVDGIVRTPFFAPNGSLVLEEGYHPDPRLYLKSVVDLPAPVTGSYDDMITACCVVDRLFQDMAFETLADKANAVAAFLTPPTRELVRGLVPNFAFTAFAPGSGKDTTMQACFSPWVGPVQLTPEPESLAEWHKVITSLLLEGSRVIYFGNLKTRLDSGPLAAALTAPVWRGRVLGQSKTVAIPNRAVWCVTGNNLRAHGEQARRMVRIHLDAGVERPEARAFKVDDFERHLREQRGTLVWAGLTMVEWYLRGWGAFAGHGDRVIVGSRLMGSFTEWSKLMHAILSSLLWPGDEPFGKTLSGAFLGNMDETFSDVDEEAATLAGFFAAWHREIPEPITAHDLARQLTALGNLRPVAPQAILAIRPEDLAAKLGNTLGQWNGQVHGGLKLVRTPDPGKRKPATWSVVDVPQVEMPSEHSAT